MEDHSIGRQRVPLLRCPRRFRSYVGNNRVESRMMKASSGLQVDQRCEQGVVRQREYLNASIAPPPAGQVNRFRVL